MNHCIFFLLPFIVNCSGTEILLDQYARGTSASPRPGRPRKVFLEKNHRWSELSSLTPRVLYLLLIQTRVPAVTSKINKQRRVGSSNQRSSVCLMYKRILLDEEPVVTSRTEDADDLEKVPKVHDRKSKMHSRPDEIYKKEIARKSSSLGVKINGSRPSLTRRRPEYFYWWSDYSYNIYRKRIVWINHEVDSRRNAKSISGTLEITVEISVKKKKKG